MKVSILIVTFNSESVITECLDSLIRIDYGDFEILIYDNASLDNTCRIIERYKDKVRLIKGGFNRGFGYALNRLAENANGEIIASLNPDTVVDRYWIKNAIGHFSRSDVGMVSSRILFKDNPDIIDSTGHLIYPDGLNRGRGHQKNLTEEFLKVDEVAFPSGSAGFYRRDIYIELGGIDESLFLFGDDTDIGIKFQLAGYKCIYEPASVVFHHYSHSVGRYSDIKAYFVERNRIQILLKYFPLRFIAKSLFYTSSRIVMHNLSAISGRGSTARYIKEGSIIKLYKLMLMAYIDTILDLPDIIRKRRKLLSRLDLEKIVPLLKRHTISASELTLTD
ncbi:MAG: glycosyltransferase family 2 protein [Myxococcota bacterium]